jgi:hypothetical protein
MISREPSFRSSSVRSWSTVRAVPPRPRLARALA